MTVLLDTHIVIWLSATPERIPALQRNVVLRCDRRLVSAVTAAEIAIKERKLGQAFRFSLELLDQAVKMLACEELPLRIAHHQALPGIPKIHEDLFDHLLISQAIVERCPLMTLDHDIRRYDLPGLMLL